jgi:AraC-like DNA-binding protein
MSEVLKTGNYLGVTKRSVDYNGIVMTDTFYTKEDVFAVHSHENPYIAYVLEGNYIESTGKITSRCMPGSVVLHNSDEKHSNTSFAEKNRILNAEISIEWLKVKEISFENLKKNINKNKFYIQLMFSNLHKEYLLNDFVTPLAIESGFIDLFSNTLKTGSFHLGTMPPWAVLVKEMLHFEDPSKLNLSHIAEAAGIHPVHISRDFHRYFLCSMSEYVRKLKIEKAVSYLKSEECSLAEISYKCGFSDQSHFTRTFRSIKGITPQVYKDLILK